MGRKCVDVNPRRAVILLLSPISRFCNDECLLQNLQKIGVSRFGDFLFLEPFELLEIDCPGLQRLVRFLRQYGLCVGQYINEPVIEALYADALSANLKRPLNVFPQGAGNPHPACPLSERRYHGGRFHSAEW